MANTFTQIHIQVVFAVKNRESLISEEWENDLYKYATGIIQNQGHKLLQINGMSDHIHILIGMRPVQALSDLIRIVKSETSKWINENSFVKKKFKWQEGYGAFSYSQSQVPNVIKYIQNQKIHHQSKSFYDEYNELLKSFEIEYDDRYTFSVI